MTFDTAQTHWPQPTLEVTDHVTCGQSPSITYQRNDGETVRIRAFEDGEGRLVITIYGTEGADIELVEDDESGAAITVEPFQSLLAATTDEPTDKEQHRDHARTHCWGVEKQGRWWRYLKTGTTITALYSTAGRLIYGCQAGPGDTHTAFTGRARAQQLRQALADNSRT
ncbi:hypothetical protein [Mycobacteroides abscessus]|uniref:hypothetical protein n=1 Tax=Mycobacteroides abscessus TaxID=36809 RepID=UPI0009A690EC|nr:hypothetical protein [Mycobacteroides abscessus]SKO15448.1 Uncharacterised protein [Mycobacteroides abscessus subsp. bolletii]SKX37338.1 Uncharacterised protein [Mycobacteroides abscessus subsp. bolletii]